MTAQARALATILICVSVATAPRASGQCSRSAGVFYDELHSFSVTAPRGWCATHQGDKIVVTRQGTSMVISYSFIDDPRTSVDELERQALAQLAPDAHPEHADAVSTHDGAPVHLWRLPREQLVGFLRQESILVRFDTVASSDRAMFMQIIHSFRTNASVRRTTVCDSQPVSLADTPAIAMSHFGTPSRTEDVAAQNGQPRQVFFEWDRGSAHGDRCRSRREQHPGRSVH